MPICLCVYHLWMYTYIYMPILVFGSTMICLIKDGTKFVIAFNTIYFIWCLSQLCHIGILFFTVLKKCSHIPECWESLNWKIKYKHDLINTCLHYYHSLHTSFLIPPCSSLYQAPGSSAKFIRDFLISVPLPTSSYWWGVLTHIFMCRNHPWSRFHSTVTSFIKVFPVPTSNLSFSSRFSDAIL